jgi:hypothetical protein
MKRYKVTLEPEEHQHLHDQVAAGQAAANGAPIGGFPENSRGISVTKR